MSGPLQTWIQQYAESARQALVESKAKVIKRAEKELKELWLSVATAYYADYTPRRYKPRQYSLGKDIDNTGIFNIETFDNGLSWSINPSEMTAPEAFDVVMIYGYHGGRFDGKHNFPVWPNYEPAQPVSFNPGARWDMLYAHYQDYFDEMVGEEMYSAFASHGYK